MLYKSSYELRVSFDLTSLLVDGVVQCMTLTLLPIARTIGYTDFGFSVYCESYKTLDLSLLSTGRTMKR